jgi:hypothetical protein
MEHYPYLTNTSALFDTPIFGVGEAVGVIAGIMRVIADTYDEVERAWSEGGAE